MTEHSRDTDMRDRERDERDVLWERSHRQDEAIVRIATEQATTQTELKGVVGTLQDFMTRSQNDFERLMKAITENKPTVAPMVMAALVIVGMMGAFGAWVVGGTQRENDLRFQAAQSADESMRRENDLRFQANETVNLAFTKSIDWIVARQEKAADDMNKMAFEGGKQAQKLEDVTMWTRRMDEEAQRRLGPLENRMNTVESQAAGNEATVRLLGETQQANLNRILQQTP